MSFLSTALSSGKAYLKTINLAALFYKLLVYIALGVAIGAVCYREGKHDCEQSALSSEITGLKETIILERETVVRELEVRQKALVQRLQVIGEDSREAAKLKQELHTIKGDLDEAIKARPANAACAPTVNELRLYEELAKRTRKPTS